VWTWYESIKKSGFNIFSGCTKDRGALQAWFLLDPVSRFCAQTAKKQQHFPPGKVLYAVKCIVINRVNKKGMIMGNKSATIKKKIRRFLKKKQEAKRKDLSVFECAEIVLNARDKDFFHYDNPQRQIDTLGVLVDRLIKDDENGNNTSLIGFYACIGRSLNQLIKLQKGKED